MNRKSVGIVVPVYYNESSLVALNNSLATVIEKLEKMGCDSEVVFVDDGSDENTWTALKNLPISYNAQVIRHTKNYGTVRAIRTGFNALNCDAYTCIAADLQDPPELIPEMVSHWIRGDSKVVLCTRIKKSDGFIVDILSKLFHKCMNQILDKRYPSGGFDIALIDSKYIEHFKTIPYYMYFQPLLIGLGLPFTQIPYERPKRHSGKSRNNIVKKIRDFSDSILSISNIPIRFVTFCGLMIAIAAMAYSLLLIFNKIIYGNTVPGFATLICLISFFCSLILIMLGLIGEYVWRIYDSMYGLPKSVISDCISVGMKDSVHE